MVERDINYQSWARVIFSRHHFTRERDVIWSNYQPSPLLQPLGGERNQYRGPEAGARANFLGDFKSGANCLVGRSRGEPEPIVWLDGARGTRAAYFRKAKKSLVLVLSMNPVNLFI